MENTLYAAYGFLLGVFALTMAAFVASLTIRSTTLILKKIFKDNEKIQAWDF